MTATKRLQNWFRSQCNGDWEHDSGIAIETLDNPGWTITINLANTGLDSRSFDEIALEKSEHDWLFATVKDKVFKVACGPENLEEAITLFCDWAGLNS